MVQAVSSLLSFRDRQHEAAFISSLHRGVQSSDTAILALGIIGNLLLMPRLLLNRSWTSSGAAMADAATLALYRWLACRAPARYLRHRSLLVGGVFSLHALVGGQAGV